MQTTVIIFAQGHARGYRDNIKRVPADAGPRPTTLLGRLLSAGVPREFAIKLEASRGKREYASRMTIIAPRTT
jgi:hypothetical protein